MGEVVAFRQKKVPTMRGSARCLHCRHTWEVVVPEGMIMALECPQCGLWKGVLEGLIEPGHGTRFVCYCGCDLFYILPEGCQCLLCGVMARGF